MAGTSAVFTILVGDAAVRLGLAADVSTCRGEVSPDVGASAGSEFATRDSAVRATFPARGVSVAWLSSDQLLFFKDLSGDDLATS